ncbi:MAG: sigma-70 family RNA polymerase sigma factor [candidate division KSB1 bacterium]|nr:sigma-70 family RNA polymerase sigma factor [candidate division KSB1 bacterium]MDZ7274853.1 sigma-70 family RNA polymerase sigma factor [candidate division KSB1 bacterium]MDZ7288220.1 sigma-70 family RNA polymerase sigma factor [candidate division KSB1 bacterium]MDZ7300399.1 sigma-70 family RNA polymerase sigma factor [candidate division KSB1 bacterium]MDZ7308774.1 sigma-70 family RNA polymerase sigma factor [candidate division KSB1 bacterium]
MTDADLIARFVKGDVNAFNTLVWRWQKTIYNFVLRYVGNREEAHDLTQQVFMRVHRSLPRLNKPASFSTWIHQIAANLCRDWIKQRRRRPAVSLENLQENGAADLHKHPALTLFPEASQHPDRIVSRNQLRELIEKALQEIPEEQRVVVIMKEYQGLKFTEIAEVLGAPVNTVKSRLYYGLSALRKVLARWQLDDEVLHYEM